ncbi:FHA domain-containing protein [Maioricimonas sp. JC845]|uniref:FHA domain-containing protein n=1 Tax=Maioricimonas sp. JC845 TaxID=3232138 RepID=UPI003458FDE4
MSDEQWESLDMLRHATGADRPLRFALQGPAGGPPDYIELDRPYALVGRSPQCDIHIDSKEIAYRHAYIQVYAQRVWCVDLFSAGGVVWDGPPTHGWLSPEHKLKIGKYTLQLFDDGWKFDGSLPAPTDLKPHKMSQPEFGGFPKVDLELLNKQFGGHSWPINRILTLLGRDDRCRITCTDREISRVHCGLLMLPSGLWAINMLGRGGIAVNGRQRECTLVGNGHELSFGPYNIRAVYRQGEASPPDPVTPESTPPAPAPAPPQAPMTASSQSGTQLPSPEFLTRQHQIFSVEIEGDTVVVTPKGDTQRFMYRDIQLEANRVKDVLTTYRYQNLIVDFGRVDLVGTIIIESLTGFCRSVKGQAVMCSASEPMKESLQSMNLTSIWPLYETREEAVSALNRHE